MPVITERVALAREGKNPCAIGRLKSGWVVMGEVQFVPGYCLLLPDPVVPSLNHLAPDARAQYLHDMASIGDVLLHLTDAHRINYEILGNLEPELHAHVFPRYASEPEALRQKPVWFYDWQAAPRFSEEQHGALRNAIRDALGALQ